MSTNEHENLDREFEFNTTPNWLTLLRMAFVPVVVALLFEQKPAYDVAAAFSFGAAAITDYFDGWLARRRSQVTVYGKLMDPLADKFLVACSLIMLQQLGRITAIIVMILICREIAITGLRALASAEGVIIPASRGAKWKTATQMVAIPCLMVRNALWGLPLEWPGMVLLYLSLAISLWSARDYVVDFFRGAREKRRARLAARHAAD